MKITHKDINGKDGKGSVTLIPEDMDDLWQVYNLIIVDDIIRASTYRKVVKQTTSSVASEKVRTTVELRIQSVEFDAVDGFIRISGVNTSENAVIMLGAHHTMTIEPNRKLTLTKESWGFAFLKKLKKAADPTQKAHLAVLLMQPGISQVCLITPHLTLIKSRVEKSIPKKKGAPSAVGRADAFKKFFSSTTDSLLRHVDFNIIKCVLIASPGFLKDRFKTFMLEEAQKRVAQGNDESGQFAAVIKRKDIFITASCAGADSYLIEGLLQDPSVQKAVSETSIVKEANAMKKFLQVLSKDSDRAVYSYRLTRFVFEEAALQTLLVSDTVFKSPDVKMRQLINSLIEECENSGVEVLTLSPMHQMGKELDQLSGVAGILRYPIPNLIELADESGIDVGYKAEKDEPRIVNISEAPKDALPIQLV